MAWPAPFVSNSLRLCAPACTPIRILQLEDYSKGFLNLLGQLTTVGEITMEQFKARFDEMATTGDYRIVVIEDVAASKIVGSATLAVERKFIHSCGKVGHIEDVVVDSTYRGKHLGQRLIEALIEASKELGCYKVILDCAESNGGFYAKCGLVKKEIQMVKYLDR